MKISNSYTYAYIVHHFKVNHVTFNIFRFYKVKPYNIDKTQMYIHFWSSEEIRKRYGVL